MNPDLISLYKSRIAIEQKIHQLKKAVIAESKQAKATELLSKLETKLVRINESIAEASSDVDLDRTKSFAKSHYTGLDPEKAFQKWVQRSLQHSEEDDARQDEKIDQLERDVKRLKMKREGLGEANKSKKQGYQLWPGDKKKPFYQGPKDKDGKTETQKWAEKRRQEKEAKVDEAVAAYGPGEDPQAAQKAPGTSTPNQQQKSEPGQQSPTPTTGGATPIATTPGMVKMAKLGPDKKPQGTPLMVRSTDIAAKQKQGYFVIGESKELTEGQLSDFRAPFSASGLWVSDRHGTSVLEVTSHGKLAAEVADALNKYMSNNSIKENASAGASSAGGIAGSPTGFASGGIGMQKRVKEAAAPSAIKKIRDNMTGIDQLSKDKDGNLIFRKAFYYKSGGTADSYARRIDAELTKLDIPHTILDSGEVFRPFKGGASVKAQSHWWVKVKLGQAEGTMSDAEKASSGPEFTGYWKGTDKGTPGNKMVGGGM